MHVCRLPKGEKEKSKTKKKAERVEKDVESDLMESELDLKEIGQHNYDILVRKGFIIHSIIASYYFKGL